MVAISRTSSFTSALRTPIGFLISKKRFASQEEIEECRKSQSSNYLQNASILTWLGIGSVLVGILSGLFARLKESTLAKTIGKIFGYGGILVTALGIFNEAVAKPATGTENIPKPNALGTQEKPVSTALVIIEPGGTQNKDESPQNTGTSRSFWSRISFKRYKEKIIQGVRSDTFSFLDDPDINGLVGGVLGMPGLLILDVLRILRHSAQVGEAIPAPQEQAKLKKCYETLGVPEDASFDEIKAAYRKLARQYHPDTSPLDKKEAEELFKELQSAYDALEKRLEQQKRN